MTVLSLMQLIWSYFPSCLCGCMVMLAGCTKSYNIWGFLRCFVDCASRCNHVKKNQHDAQLILSLFRQPLHVSGVSRPIIRRYNHMYTTVGTYYSFWMTVCRPGWIGTEFQFNQDNRQSSKKRIISTNCIHTVVPPDDGPRYTWNMYRLTKYTKNKLCISWFSLHECMAVFCTLLWNEQFWRFYDHYWAGIPWWRHLCCAETWWRFGKVR